MKKSLLLVCSLLAFVTSCVKEPETHQLILEKHFSTLYADHTIDSLVFYTFDSWDVTPLNEWIAIEGSSVGKIQYNSGRRYRCVVGLMVTPNTTGKTRDGYVRVSSYDYVSNAIYLQNGWLNITRPAYKVESYFDEGKTVPESVSFTLTVDAQTEKDNLTFEVQNGWSLAFEGTAPDWVTLEKTFGDKGKNTVDLVFTPNSDVDNAREAKLRLTSGAVSNVITIQQRPTKKD